MIMSLSHHVILHRSRYHHDESVSSCFDTEKVVGAKAEVLSSSDDTVVRLLRQLEQV